MAQMWQNILAPVGIWFHQQLTDSSEKIIKQYHEDTKSSTLLKDLFNLLPKLVDIHERTRDTYE